MAQISISSRSDLTLPGGNASTAALTGSRPTAATRNKIPLTSLAGVAISGLCAYLNLYTTQPLLPSLSEAFHATRGEVSLTVSATTLAVALSAPFIGIFADRIGRKRVIVPAMFLSAVPTLMAALCHSLPELIFWRFAQGLILPAIFAVSMAYVVEEWAEFGLGMAMTVYVTGNVLGGFTGRLVSGLAAAHGGWHFSFMVLAGLDLLCALGALALLPPARKFKAGPHSSPHCSMWEAIGQSLTTQLKSPALLGTFIVGANILFSLVALFTYVTFHLAAAPYSLGVEALSWLFAVYLFGAVVTPQTGKLIDRHGLTKALCGAMLISTLSNYLTLIPHLAWVLAGLALSSGALFICQSATTSSLRRFAVTGTSSAAGLYVCFYYLGGSLGGYLPSLAWNFMDGRWPMCVALISGMQLLSLILALILWHRAEKIS